MSKRIFIFLAIFLIVLGFLIFNFKKPKKIEAAATDNVWGWAWSENIGWISFNSTNTGSAINYGVNIDSSNGTLSGQAWSENIGWISFNRSDTSVPPQPPFNGAESYIATLDLGSGICGGTGNFCGWVRTLTACDSVPCPSSGAGSNTGGWDGWIKLKGNATDGSPYGVILNNASHEFEGWAWGSDVLGWISFNTINYAGGSDYKVLSSFVINNPPTAAISCHPDGCAQPSGICQGYSGIFCLKNASSDPNNNISNSVWTIKDSGGTTVQTLDCSSTGNPLCDIGTITLSAGIYTAQLDVVDAGGLSDTTSTSFSLLQDIIADFKCSFSPAGPWQNCLGFGVEEGVVVYFLDISTPSTGATINNRSWTFQDGSPASAGNTPNPTSTFIKVDANSGKVTLQVWDTAGRTDTQTYQLQITLPLPKWKEIKP